MLDTHACFISFIALPDRPLQSTLESRSRRSPVLSTTLSSPLTRSILAVPRQEASPFDRVVFVLAFLRYPCILCLYSANFSSANLVLSSFCIRALVAPGLY